MKKILLFATALLLIILIPTELGYIFESRNTDTRNGSGDVVTNDPNEELPPEEVEDELEEERPVQQEKPPVTQSSGEWWEYPDDIKLATRNGNDLLVLVNKEYKLPSTYAPTDLVIVGESVMRRGSKYSLRSIVINDLKAMNSAAKADGIDLSIVSAYRSYATQQDTYNYWLSKNNNNVAYVDTFSARPGHSQHQLGTVIDFSSNEIGDKLGDSFTNTKASKWLVNNAYKYGFVISYPKGYESTTGYKYESWHYRYIGKSNALEMKNSGKILEIYLRGKN